MNWVLAASITDLLSYTSAHPAVMIAALVVGTISVLAFMVTFAKQSPAARRDLIEALRVLLGRK